MDDNTNDEPTNKDIIAALEQSELTITNLRNILAKTSAQAETWRRVSESTPPCISQEKPSGEGG